MNNHNWLGNASLASGLAGGRGWQKMNYHKQHQTSGLLTPVCWLAHFSSSIVRLRWITGSFIMKIPSDFLLASLSSDQANFILKFLNDLWPLCKLFGNFSGRDPCCSSQMFWVVGSWILVFRPGCLESYWRTSTQTPGGQKYTEFRMALWGVCLLLTDTAHFCWCLNLKAHHTWGWKQGVDVCASIKLNKK